jgi:hypothetical protein
VVGFVEYSVVIFEVYMVVGCVEYSVVVGFVEYSVVDGFVE